MRESPHKLQPAIDLATESTLTVPEIAANISSLLRERDIESPERKSDELLAFVVQQRPLQIYTEPSRQLTPEEQCQLRALTLRVSQHEPLQHVIGTAGFMNHEFVVDGRTLIPRPETELLVNMILEHPELWSMPNPRLADVGTGSGCVILSLAHARPAATYIGTDRSDEILELAKLNAMKLGISSAVSWHTGPFLKALPQGKYNLIVANLPYVTTEEYSELPMEVCEYEPREALESGADGLNALRTVIREAPDHLTKPGWLYLEIGSEQGIQVTKLMRDAGFTRIVLTQDLSGRDRVICGTIS